MAKGIKHLVFLLHGVTSTPKRTYAHIINLFYDPDVPLDPAKVTEAGLGIYAVEANVDDWYQFGMSKMMCGLEAAGDRAYDEIVKTLHDTPSVKEISFVGCSLGGILARYVVGKMIKRASTYKQSNKPEPEADAEHMIMIDDSRYITLNTYIALASPNLGMTKALYRPPSWVLYYLGPWFRTMSDMFVETGKNGFIYKLCYNEYLHGLNAFKKRVAFCPRQDDGVLHPVLCNIKMKGGLGLCALESIKDQVPEETFDMLTHNYRALAGMKWEVVFANTDHRALANAYPSGHNIVRLIISYLLDV
jgi:hypothetical protein